MGKVPRFRCRRFVRERPSNREGTRWSWKSVSSGEGVGPWICGRLVVWKQRCQTRHLGRSSSCAHNTARQAINSNCSCNGWLVPKMASEWCLNCITLLLMWGLKITIENGVLLQFASTSCWYVVLDCIHADTFLVQSSNGLRTSSLSWVINTAWS